MNRQFKPIFLFVLLSSLIPHPSSLLRADGGAVRLRQRAGGYQVAVFTMPTPFRAGLVDVSVLVQDAATGECVPKARVTVRLTALGTGEVLEQPATMEAATNRLFHAAVFHLPESGWWDVQVAVYGPHGPAVVRFGVEADEPPPRWLELWPWFTWPALVVALFGLHRVLVRRKAAVPGTPAFGQWRTMRDNGGSWDRQRKFASGEDKARQCVPPKIGGLEAGVIS
jgi:hypothetical protein